LVGELRQGALEGVLTEAVAAAAGLEAATVRDALMIEGDLALVGEKALREGAAGLAARAIRLFRPILPMLAGTASSPAEALERFVRQTLAEGHEGVLLKAPDSPYRAGRRGTEWLKWKPAVTLDLVVLAAEWGHGRRRGWLSNLHLGARDPVHGGFVMIGKTFKGLTDEMLAWQTERLLGLERSRDEWTVRAEPSLVVEVAFDGVQRSPRYPGGVALRFARVKRYRTDKSPAEADTIDT